MRSQVPSSPRSPATHTSVFSPLWSPDMLVSFVLAAFAIKYLVEQVIVGVVLNVLVVGLTGFFYSSVLSSSPELNNPDRLPAKSIARVVMRPTLVPAILAAAGLRPTVRNWNPRLERSMNHQ